MSSVASYNSNVPVAAAAAAAGVPGGAWGAQGEHAHGAGDSCCEPSLPQLLGPVSGGRSRGDITGDCCVTADLFAAETLACATWSEVEQQCAFHCKKERAVLRIGAELQQTLSSASSKAWEQEMLTQIEFNITDNASSTSSTSSSSSSSNTFHPLSQLLRETDNASLSMDAAPKNDVLLGMLLAHTLRQLDDAQPSTTEGAESVTAHHDHHHHHHHHDEDRHQHDKPKKNKKKEQGSKKGTKGRKRLTMVVPCGLIQPHREALLRAAAWIGQPVKCMFNRGVAALAGALHREDARDSKPVLRGMLNREGKSTTVARKHPIVMYFNVVESLPSASDLWTNLAFDAALIQCEGSGAGSGPKELANPLGFDRLCTVASMGGLVQPFYDVLVIDKQLSNVASSKSKGSAAAATMTADQRISLQLADLCCAVCWQLLVQAGLIDSAGSEVDKIVSVLLVDGLLLAGRKLSLGHHFTTDGLRNVCIVASSGRSKLSTAAAGEVSPLTKVLPLAAASVAHASAEDAVVGGCVLSAAELESSKQYVQLDSGWKIAYQLPVADSALEGGNLALRTFWSKEEFDRATAPSPEVLFSDGARLWKVSTGSLRSSIITAATTPKDKDEGEDKSKSKSKGKDARKQQQMMDARIIERKFEGGSAYFNRSAQVGWPKVQILQCVRTFDGSQLSSSTMTEKWCVLHTVEPLLTAAVVEGEKAEREPVENSTMTVELLSATGQVSVVTTVGRSLPTVRAAHRWWVQLILLLLLPFALWGGYRYSVIANESHAYGRDVAWLTDFYKQNAPEKLSDAQYVSRTLKKYDGKMFLLWRNLEKTYKVKWTPPASIVDDSVGDL